MMEPTVIWSGEHGAWWRASASGYTTDLWAAGIYDRRDAERYTSSIGPEKQVEVLPLREVVDVRRGTVAEYASRPSLLRALLKPWTWMPKWEWHLLRAVWAAIVVAVVLLIW